MRLTFNFNGFSKQNFTIYSGFTLTDAYLAIYCLIGMRKTEQMTGI